MDIFDLVHIRNRQNYDLIGKLLLSKPHRFDSNIRSTLPEQHGIYRIFHIGKESETLRAGRTKTAAGGLRQRVYQNHLMGNQSGNLRSQLVNSGRCETLEGAKAYIRENCMVQFVVIENESERKWAEYFLLGMLQPKFSD